MKSPNPYSKLMGLMCLLLIAGCASPHDAQMEKLRQISAQLKGDSKRRLLFFQQFDQSSGAPRSNNSSAAQQLSTLMQSELRLQNRLSSVDESIQVGEPFRLPYEVIEESFTNSQLRVLFFYSFRRSTDAALSDGTLSLRQHAQVAVEVDQLSESEKFLQAALHSYAVEKERTIQLVNNPPRPTSDPWGDFFRAAILARIAAGPAR